MKDLQNIISPIQIPMKWYSVFLLVIPAMIGTLLVGPKTLAETEQSKEERDERKSKKKLRNYKKELKELKNHQNPEWAEKRRQYIERDTARIEKELQLDISPRDILYFLWQIIITIVIYAAITAAAILLFSIVRYCNLPRKNTGITVWSVWRGFSSPYIASHWKEVILLPCMVAIAAKGIKSLRWKSVLCGLLSVVLVILPLVTNSGTTSILPMENEILAELKSNPIFDYSLSDIEGFQSRAHAGYTKKQPAPAGEDNDVHERPLELELDISALTIDQLMECIGYLSDIDVELLQTYVERAYELYSSGADVNHFNTGTILFYYAEYHDYPIYLQAASEYEEAEPYWNAALCLKVYCQYEKGVFMDFTTRLVDDAILAVKNRQASFPMTYCEDIMTDSC